MQGESELKKFVVRGLIFFPLYYFIAFIIIAAISFFYQTPSVTIIIEDFALSHKILNILKKYCSLISTLQVAGILIFFSWYFFDLTKIVKETESFLFDLLKYVLIVTLILLSITITVEEIALPLLEQKIEDQKTASSDFIDYLALAKKSLNEKDFHWTDIYAKKAFQISPSSQESFLLNRLAELKKTEVQKTQEPEIIPQKEPVLEKIESIEVLLQKAETLLTDKKFFEAHYYATLVQEIEKRSNKENTDAQRIAQQAWNMLTNMRTSLSDTSEDVFKKKKAGFTALNNESYLESYYIFKDLEKAVPFDPDVKYFLIRAEEEVKKRYFFIDETYNLGTVEAYRNIYFSIKNPDKSTDIIRILGISQIEEAGNLVLYLRGLSFISYSEENELLRAFEARHAKIIIMNTNDLNEDSFKSITNQVAFSSNQRVPYLILNAVDREDPKITLNPYYIFPSNHD
ncbi:MAG: hypothetical protein ACRC5H_08035, partial [Treponemataceae bacterium]